jgi:hypothetical protein
MQYIAGADRQHRRNTSGCPYRYPAIAERTHWLGSRADTRLCVPTRLAGTSFFGIQIDKTSELAVSLLQADNDAARDLNTIDTP